MKIQFAQSSREIECTKVSRFKVTQDNRQKEIVAVEFDTTAGSREMTFLNGVECVLNSRNRYVQAQSNKEFCARILPEPEAEPVGEELQSEEVVQMKAA